MSDENRFESALAGRLTAYAAEADRPFDAAAVARIAVSTGRRRGLLDRLLPAPLPIDSRLVSIAVAFLLVAALLVVLAVVGSQLSGPERLVRLSQEVHRDPPPFTMTTTVFDPGGAGSFHGCHSDWMGPENVAQMRIRYWYDGAGHFRMDCLLPGHGLGDSDAGDYAYIVIGPDGQAGAWTGTYWFEDPAILVRTSDAPQATLEWLNWINEGSFLKDEDQPIECEEWQLGPMATVAGRPAQEVSCGTDRFWIDEASHLLVKREQDGVVISEALELEVGTVPPSSLFVLGPTNVRWPLSVGLTPEDWTLPLVGGGAFSSASLRGLPSAVLSEPAAPLVGLADFVPAASERRDRMNAVVVVNSVNPSVSAYSIAETAGVPVVVDDGTAVPSWDLAHALWLFDAQGTVVAQLDVMTRDSLDLALDAWLAGAEIPMAPAGDSVFSVGRPASPLVGSLVGGGDFDLADHVGRPAVLLSPGEWNIIGGGLMPAGLEPVEVFASASRLLGDRATLAVLAWGAPSWATWLSGPGAEVMADARVVFIADPVGLWGSLRGPNVRPDGSFTSRAAIVIVDGRGIVQHVISDDLPTAAELVALVEALGS